MGGRCAARTQPGFARFRWARTPLASGAIRGTEFELSVDTATGRTVLTLIEGAVDLSNALGEVALASGEQGIVDPGQAPRKTAALDTINVIQWTLYYPAVVVVAELNSMTPFWWADEPFSVR